LGEEINMGKYYKSILLRIEPDTLRAIDELAEQRNLPRSAVLRNILRHSSMLYPMIEPDERINGYTQEEIASLCITLMKAMLPVFNEHYDDIVRLSEGYTYG